MKEITLFTVRQNRKDGTLIIEEMNGNFKSYLTTDEAIERIEWILRGRLLKL